MACGVVLALAFFVSSPAVALQVVAEDAAAYEEGNLDSAPPPKTRLTEDGFLVVESDVYM